jgi:hypothetical protein
MAFGFAAYVSRDGFPPDRARLASGCLVKLSRAGFHPQGSNKRFLTHVMCVVLLFQASWHNPGSSRPSTRAVAVQRPV